MNEMLAVIIMAVGATGAYLASEVVRMLEHEEDELGEASELCEEGALAS